MHRRQRPHAFTLIELLVVVAIIVSLLAMLMPALGRANAVARNVKCQSALRQTALANTTYAADNARVYIYNNQSGSGKYKGVNYARYWATDERFIERLGMTPDQVSQAYRPNPGGYGGWGAGVIWPDEFKCPDTDSRLYWEATANWWGHSLGISYNRENNGSTYTMTNVSHPSTRYQFGDGENWWMNRRGSDFRQYFDTGWITYGGWGGLLPRHNLGGGDGANIAFWDGHVERVPKELTYLYKNPTGITEDAGNFDKWQVVAN